MKASWNGRILGALALMAAISSVGVMCESKTMYESATICRAPIEGLTKCVLAIKQQNPRPPTPECCAAIATADYPCLCKYKNNPILKILGIDINLGYTLPSKCGIKGAPSHC